MRKVIRPLRLHPKMDRLEKLLRGMPDDSRYRVLNELEEKDTSEPVTPTREERSHGREDRRSEKGYE